MPPGAHEPGHAIEVHLDRLLAERGMTLTELADRVGVTIVNLSILKNGRAKAIRFTTLTRLCHVLGCSPATCSVTPPPTRKGRQARRVPAQPATAWHQAGAAETP